MVGNLRSPVKNLWGRRCGQTYGVEPLVWFVLNHNMLIIKYLWNT